MNAIITGASKGIGRSIALKFAAEGYDLLLCARNQKTLERTANEISGLFPSITVRHFAVDLSDEKGAKEFGKWCNQFGTAAILVNNAGRYLPGNCIGEEDSLNDMLNANLFSAYRVTREIAPMMIKAKSGHIFNICSIAALAAYEGGGSYSISKFAMHGFSKNLRFELLPHGVKVTTVFPGAVMTDSWSGFDNSNNRIMEADDIAAMIVASNKLSIQAVVEDIVIRPQLGDL